MNAALNLHGVNVWFTYSMSLYKKCRKVKFQYIFLITEFILIIIWVYIDKIRMDHKEVDICTWNWVDSAQDRCY